MSPVTIKSANPDEIWDKWKKKSVRSQKLEKHYGVKGAVFSIDNITAAEFVKGVNKAAILFFEKSYEVKAEKTKPKSEKGDVRDIEKVKFYNFKSNPIKAEWKGNEEVPSFASLTKVNCSKCSGRGGIACKKCNGNKVVPCPDCEGKPKKCKTCDGTGKYKVEVKVLDDKNEKSTKTLEVKCNECYGTGKLTCTRCGGLGKVPCKNCNALGLNTCPECRGHGSLFTYDIKPVPFKAESSAEPILLSSIKLSGLEKELGKEIQKTIEQVEGILIRNPEKELDQKFIEPNLGYFTKEIGKISKEASKEWKNASKKKEVKIKLPIFLFPVLALDCETKKGKKFQVFCIGSEKKFQVFGQI